MKAAAIMVVPTPSYKVGLADVDEPPIGATKAREAIGIKKRRLLFVKEEVPDLSRWGRLARVVAER